jgi:hypothetical protein
MEATVESLQHQLKISLDENQRLVDENINLRSRLSSLENRDLIFGVATGVAGGHLDSNDNNSLPIYSDGKIDNLTKDANVMDMHMHASSSSSQSAGAGYYQHPQQHQPMNMLMVDDQSYGKKRGRPTSTGRADSLEEEDRKDGKRGKTSFHFDQFWDDRLLQAMTGYFHDMAMQGACHQYHTLFHTHSFQPQFLSTTTTTFLPTQTSPRGATSWTGWTCLVTPPHLTILTSPSIHPPTPSPPLTPVTL